MKTLFPHVIIGMDELVDGTLHNAPLFCKKKKVHPYSKCHAHYKSLLSEKNAFKKCPYGFASFNHYQEDTSSSIVYTSLLIKDINTHLDLKQKIESKDDIMVFTKDKFFALINYDRDYSQCLQQRDNYFLLLREYLHTTRSINSNISNHSYSLKGHVDRNCSRNTYCLPRCKGLTADSDLLRVTNKYIEFSLDGDAIIESKIDQDVNVLKGFWKYHKAIAAQARKKGINFTYQSHEYDFFYSTKKDIFDLIPYIILQNSIKHAVVTEKRNTIDICYKYSENTKQLLVTISNQGAFYNSHELNSLKLKNYRGAYAESFIPGQGLGLYSLERLCNLLNINFSLNSSDEVSDIVNTGGTLYPLSDFSVTLTFNDIYCVKTNN